MIKIDSLRIISIVVLLMAGVLLVAEVTSNIRGDTWPITILIILSVAVERVRAELRDIREQIKRQCE